MRLSVVIDGPCGSGKSLFLVTLKEWLERENLERSFFRISQIQLLEEQAPANSPRAERLLAIVEIR